MNRIILFAGTTEGRELAEFLRRHQIHADVCTATEYGGQLVGEDGFCRVHAGRLDEAGICGLIREVETRRDTGAGSEHAQVIVVDATHPYAKIVSDNIKSACGQTGAEYVRLLREESDSAASAARSAVTVEDVQGAVDFLEGTEGNILVTTGSKELPKFTALTDYRERVFARVLSTPEAAAECARLGFTGQHLICMQGPFCEELNTAMLRQFDAKWMVTKESGKTGGFEEKVRAASAAGARLVLIGRPSKEQGFSAAQVRVLLAERLGFKIRRKIALVGIGMGTLQGMTLEARQACQEAQLLVGARRMLEEFSHGRKATFISYRPEEIRAYIDAHPEYERIALLQSGDVGFYSGAKKLFETFAGEEIEVYPGISSVVYLCDKLHTPWEDVKLLSLHGRNANLAAAVKAHKKVFAIVGKAESVRELCEKLTDFGLGELSVTVGENLSYPEERIRTDTARRLAKAEFSNLCVVLIENPAASEAVTHGLEDEEFLRDKVPMTKAEIRSISLSKLRLRRDSIVYDVGAGTGSVSIEAALRATDGQVYAIEKKPEAVELIRANRQKFAAENLTVVEGLAPEAMEELPAPSHVFIGGSSGNLREIMEAALKKNPRVRLVINCIALETVSEALRCLEALPVEDVDMAAVSVAKAKPVGRYHMMMGQNPVYVISCQGRA